MSGLEYATLPRLMMPAKKEYEFAAPWEAVCAEQVAGLTAELLQELPSGHVLAGLVAVPIGRLRGKDDVLFRIGDSPFRFAVVHLTYSVESNPAWPFTEVFDSFEQFSTANMRPSDLDEAETHRRSARAQSEGL